MSNYGISILITILATSLIAFYLLYKARQLNLGILISISIGSIFLGFTFKPIYNSILQLLSASIDAKIALVVSILAVLVIFLFLILIISYIASISIPKKIASIDCCTVIDRFLAGKKVKEGFTKTGQNIRNILGKIPAFIAKTKKYVYSQQNKLKKPVDTKQIIDTMGIEKIEIAQPASEYTATEETIAAVAEPVINEKEWVIPEIEQLEPQPDEVVEDAEVSVDIEDTIFEEILPPVVSVQPDLPEFNEVSEPIIPEPDAVVEEIVPEPEDLEKLEAEIKNEETDTYEELVTEEAVPVTEVEQAEKELPEVEQNEDTDQIDSAGELIVTENTVDTELINISSEMEAINAESYIIKAFESKDQGNKVQAIDYYFKALELKPEDDMIFWIALDICTLYKQLGMSDLATIILEGLVDQYGSIIQPEIKVEIMKNLNTEND